MRVRTVSPYLVVGAWVVANGLNIVVAEEKISNATGENETLVYLLVSSLITAASSIILILWRRLIGVTDKREKEQRKRIEELEEMILKIKGK